MVSGDGVVSTGVISNMVLQGVTADFSSIIAASQTQNFFAGAPYLSVLVGGSTGGHAPGLQHQDALAGKPWLMQERQRHQCGLARTRWRFQHQLGSRSETVADGLEQRADRQGGQGSAGAGCHVVFRALCTERRG